MLVICLLNKQYSFQLKFILYIICILIISCKDFIYLIKIVNSLIQYTLTNRKKKYIIQIYI